MGNRNQFSDVFETWSKKLVGAKGFEEIAAFNARIMRRSFSTGWDLLGAPDSYTEKQLGHEGDDVKNRYKGEDVERVRHFADQWFHELTV